MREDPHTRFSRVVDHYVRYRPGYPRGLLDVLKADCGLLPSRAVADIGSGTGLLTELFLENGNAVYGVEPNADMRSAAESRLRSHALFTSVAAAAEATTLPDHSVHLVAAGQAFHWFDPEPTRREFLRVLVPGGWVALVWNLERYDGSPFSAALQRFWQTYIDPGNGFEGRNRKRPDYVTRFFGAGLIKDADFDNHQVCDFAALKGRVLSASRAPAADDPRHPAMLDALGAIFSEHARGGSVTLSYDTRMVYGRLDRPA